MGRNARIKRQRRAERGARVRHRNRKVMPPCSYVHCEQGRPQSTHIAMLQDGSGNFYAACDDCIEPMMAALRAKGIDAQVVSRQALEQLERAASKPKPPPPPSYEEVEARLVERMKVLQDTIFDHTLPDNGNFIRMEKGCDLHQKIEAGELEGFGPRDLSEREGDPDGIYLSVSKQD